MGNHAEIGSVRDIPAVQARQMADRPAVTVGGQCFSYADLGARAGRTAANLRALGLNAGQRVAWLGTNSIHWFWSNNSNKSSDNSTNICIQHWSNTTFWSGHDNCSCNNNCSCCSSCCST